MAQLIGAVAAAVTYEVLGDIAGAAVSTWGLGAQIIASVAAFSVAYETSSLLGPKRTGGPSGNPAMTLRQPISNHILVDGQVRRGGALTFVDSNGGEAALTVTNNKVLHLLITMSARPIKGFDALYFNDSYVPLDSFGSPLIPPNNPDGSVPVSYQTAGKIYFATGTVAGDANLLSKITAGTLKWTSDCRQGGHAKIYAELVWNNNLFGSSGIPNISAIMRGRLVYDPRDTGKTLTSSTAANPAVFTTSASHGFAVGDMVWIKNHSGATYSFGGVTYDIANEYEIASAPSSTTFTLIGPDDKALALTNAGSGGTVTKMRWTDNAELLINDYLCDPIYGFEADYDTEIPESLLTAGANTCDEMVDRTTPLTTTFTADASTDLITWATGQNAGAIANLSKVTLSNSGGGLPGGLSSGTIYFYAAAGSLGNTGYLCTSLANAQANPPTKVNITSAGTGTQTLTVIVTFTADATLDTLTLYQTTLRILTGSKVQVASTSSLPTGLSAATDYYALLFTDEGVIRLASSLANARDGTYINLTSAGSGTMTITCLSEPRYTLNGAIDTALDRQSIVQTMLTSMGGYLVPNGVTLSIFPAAYRTPTVHLDERDLRGPIRVETLRSAQTTFNSVKGTFYDPFSASQPTDIPPYQNPTYIAADGGEIVWKDLQLPFTNSSSMAQRLEKIDLERTRRELTLTQPCKLTPFQLSAADVVMVDNTMWGWDDETFEISAWTFAIQNDQAGVPSLGVDLVCRQTDSAVFAWTAAEEAAAKRQSNTNLPNPFVVQPPTGLTLASGDGYLIVQADGTVVSRIKVSWTAPNDQFVQNGGFIEIAYKKSADTDWLAAPTVAGSAEFGFIENAAIGINYDVEARSRNSVGAVSDTDHPWQASVTNYTVLGHIAAPSDISTLTITETGTVLTLAGSPITDTDVAAYEYRYAATMVWTGATFIEAPAATPTPGGVAGVCTVGNIPAGTWWFSVKAKNTSGVYSVNAAFNQHTVVKQIDNSMIADGSIPALKLAFSIQGIDVLSSLPTSANYEGRLVFLTTDGQLYRYHSGAFTLAVPTVNLTGTITNAQLAAGAVDTAKIASGLSFVEIVSSLPGSGNYDGRFVYLTTDQKLYKYNGGASAFQAVGGASAFSDLTGTITTTQIGTSTILTANLGANQVTAAKIAANTITASQIAAGTITATEIASSTITGGKIAAATITGSLIAAGTITASNITSATITATQIAAATITSNEMATNSIIAGKIASGAINSSAILVSDIVITGSINGLAVTTAKIANGAVTSGLSVNAAGPFDDVGAEHTFATGTYTASGGGVLVQVYMEAENFSGTPGDSGNFKLYNGATLITPYYQARPGGSYETVVNDIFLYPSGSGSQTWSLTCEGDGFKYRNIRIVVVDWFK